MADGAFPDTSRSADAPNGSGEAFDSGEERAPDASFVGNLLYRRVPQVLAGYLGVTWTLFELAQWLTDQYLISPYLGRALLFGLLLLLPSVLLITYRHGRPGPDRWVAAERYGVGANVVLAVGLLAFVYGDVELGSMVRTVQTSSADPAVSEGSRPAAQQVPKRPFRKRIALFYFDETGRAQADTSLRRMTALALRTDLEQDAFIDVYEPLRFAPDLREHGYGDGLNVPLGLKREIAQEKNVERLLSGQVASTVDGFRLTTQLHDTKTGELLAERTYEGPRFFSLIDRASRTLKKDLDLPEAHRERVPDLPVTQVFTTSLEAARAYAEGYHHLADDGAERRRNSLQKYRRAMQVDSTFALSYLQAGALQWTLGLRDSAREALRKAQRHSYRLTETKKHLLRVLRLFRVEGRPQAALEICKRWTSLRPHDLTGWDLQAEIYERLLRSGAAAESYQRVLEVAPGTKSAERGRIEALLAAGQTAEALRQSQSYVQSYPKDAAGRILRGVARWQRGRHSAAEEDFRQATIAGDPIARFYLSALHDASGEPTKSRAQARNLVTDDELKTGGLRRLWHHFWLRGQIDRSLHLRDSLRTPARAEDGPPDQSQVFYAMHTCEYYGPLGRSPLVKTSLQRIRRRLQTVPDSGNVRERVSVGTARVRCLIHLDRTEAARQALTRLDALVQREGTPYLRMHGQLDVLWGRLQERSGNLQKAIQHYETYLDAYAGRSRALIRTLPLPRLRLARAYHKAGQPDQAASTYQRALEIRPAHPYLNLYYARLLADLDRSQAAQRHVQRALEAWAPAKASFPPKQRARALSKALGNPPT